MLPHGIFTLAYQYAPSWYTSVNRWPTWHQYTQYISEHKASRKKKVRRRRLLIPATPPPHYKPSTLPSHPPSQLTSSPHPSINLLPIFDFAKGNSIIGGVRKSRPKWQNCSDFQCCSESDEMYCAVQTIFVETISLCFFTSGETRLQTRSWKSNSQPPPPSPPTLPPASNSVQCIQQTCTVFWLSKIEMLCSLETEGWVRK